MSRSPLLDQGSFFDCAPTSSTEDKTGGTGLPIHRIGNRTSSKRREGGHSSHTPTEIGHHHNHRHQVEGGRELMADTYRSSPSSGGREGTPTHPPTDTLAITIAIIIIISTVAGGRDKTDILIRWSSSLSKHINIDTTGTREGGTRPTHSNVGHHHHHQTSTPSSSRCRQTNPSGQNQPICSE